MCRGRKTFSLHLSGHETMLYISDGIFLCHSTECLGICLVDQWLEQSRGQSGVGSSPTKNTQFVFLCFAMYWWSLINPRRACAVRVTVVGSVCLCVCPLLNISPLERLFVSHSVPHTQRAAKVRNFVWFSLKMLRCRARELPSLYGYALVGHVYSATYTCAHNDRCAWARK